MAFELTSKKETKKPFWLNLILYLSFSLFIVAVLGYFVLDYSNKKASELSLQLQDKINEQKAPILPLEEELSRAQAKVDNFSILLDEHKLNSRLFSLIEKLTSPEVSFGDLDFNASEAKIELSGQTSNFKSLGEQLLIFQEEKDIKEVKLSSVSLGEKGDVKFILDISLDPKVISTSR